MERAELIKLIRATGCAEERGEMFFLCDPAWREREAAKLFPPGGAVDNGWLGIPTGGTSGKVRFARHDEWALTTAVRGFCGHFGIERVNAVGVLPAYHVSGLMARVRCAETGGEHLPWDWKRLESGERPVLRRGEDWVISLVPTQLQRLLASPAAVEWLRGFQVIFVGGGPVWPELAEAAARAQLRISLSYGMTETAAMVTALQPEEFLAGARSSGTPLPHATVTVTEEGVVSIAGDSVFRGYWPERRDSWTFVTEDVGWFDEHGHLHIEGRRDAVIITGGKKVHTAEVEAELRASGEFLDVGVIGVPDKEWGQLVVACYPAGGRNPDVGRAVATLTGANKPKRFIAVAPWPRNAQGKLNRAMLTDQAWAVLFN